MALLTKVLASALSLLLVASAAAGDSALMEGGRSPDGRYEVRIDRAANVEPSDYVIRIHKAGTGKSVYTLDAAGGYLRFSAAVERCRALWHASSIFVAITEQGTRHSKELYLVALYPDRVERLELPDYVQNALGRVGATEVDFSCISTPMRWDGDDLIVQFYFTANGRHAYKCDVALHVSHGKHSAPYVGLKSVSQPTEQEE